MGCWRALVASCSTLESHARLTCGPSQAVGSIFRPPALPLFLVRPCCAKMRVERCDVLLLGLLGPCSACCVPSLQKKSHCACGLSRELRQVPQEFAGKWCWVLAGDVIHPMEKHQIVRELPACSDCRVCVASRAPGWL